MKKLFITLLCLTTAATVFAQSKKYWGNTALNDVHGIYWAYTQYHAGMADPENRDFSYKLYDIYKKYSKKAYKAKSEAQYQKVLKEYMAAFNDGSMFVIFDNDITPAKKETPKKETKYADITLMPLNSEMGKVAVPRALLKKPQRKDVAI